MRMLAVVGLALAFGVVVTVACSGPGPTNDACTSAAGVCQSSKLACYESLPYPCNAAANLVCCTPGATGSAAPTGDVDAAASSTGTTGTTTPDAAATGG